MDQEFGHLIRDLRQARPERRTLRETAEDLGISVPYLSDIENGRRNPLRGDLLRKAAKVFGVDESTLLESSAESTGDVRIPLPSRDERADAERRSLIKRFAGRVASLAAEQAEALQLVLSNDAIVFSKRSLPDQSAKLLLQLRDQIHELDDETIDGFVAVLDRDGVVARMKSPEVAAGARLILNWLQATGTVVDQDVVERLPSFVDARMG